jgi:hypothetical protein
MFLLYRSRTTESNGVLRLEQVQRVSLFGCRQGLIPRALAKLLPSGAGQPCQWRLCARDIIRLLGLPGDEIVIDADPKNQKGIWLYRLREVYGHSEADWTPMLWHCDGLTDGASPDSLCKSSFEAAPERLDAHIFTRAYARGTILDGDIRGTWSPPGPSSTNGPLLWPHVMTYFIGITREILDKTASATAAPNVLRVDCCSRRVRLS